MARRRWVDGIGRGLRSPWLLPGAWLAGMAAAGVWVLIPEAGGRPGVVTAALSFVLALVLVASVAVVAVALVVAAARRVLSWMAAAARAYAASGRRTS